MSSYIHTFYPGILYSLQYVGLVSLPKLFCSKIFCFPVCTLHDIMFSIVGFLQVWHVISSQFGIAACTRNCFSRNIPFLIECSCYKIYHWFLFHKLCFVLMISLSLIMAMSIDFNNVTRVRTTWCATVLVHEHDLFYRLEHDLFYRLYSNTICSIDCTRTRSVL